jgi:hypothetical protein
MKHTEIWYGNMTHGEFSIAGDCEAICIVHSIEEKSIMNPNDVDEYLISQGYDSYLIPSEFKGIISFSQDFLKGLSE